MLILSQKTHIPQPKALFGLSSTLRPEPKGIESPRSSAEREIALIVHFHGRGQDRRRAEWRVLTPQPILSLDELGTGRSSLNNLWRSSMGLEELRLR